MSKQERQGIAGFEQGSTPPWGWFGSMFGAGVFKKIVNANSVNLSRALDAIRCGAKFAKSTIRNS
jgi:hypothetical protein